MQSGLIANTRGDLEVLKHKGDRQYYEFTLMKGAKPQAISTVKLQLKKTDPKHGKYTLDVTSDDKTIEKKDRNQSEPVQFYTGRDHMLYELVVWTVDKKKITGYLSTPKNAPMPITAIRSNDSCQRPHAPRNRAPHRSHLSPRPRWNPPERQKGSRPDDALRSRHCFCCSRTPCRTR